MAPADARTFGYISCIEDRANSPFTGEASSSIWRLRAGRAPVRVAGWCAGSSRAGHAREALRSRVFRRRMTSLPDVVRERAHHRATGASGSQTRSDEYTHQVVSPIAYDEEKRRGDHGGSLIHHLRGPSKNLCSWSYPAPEPNRSRLQLMFALDRQSGAAAELLRTIRSNRPRAGRGGGSRSVWNCTT